MRLRDVFGPGSRHTTVGFRFRCGGQTATVEVTVTTPGAWARLARTVDRERYSVARVGPLVIAATLFMGDPEPRPRGIDAGLLRALGRDELARLTAGGQTPLAEAATAMIESYRRLLNPDRFAEAAPVLQAVILDEIARRN